MRLGLIGHPVKHSLSPPMHRAAFLFFELAGSYELFDLPESQFHDGIQDLIQRGLAGLNATIPHKESLLRLASVDNRSREAKIVGAANCLRIDSAGNLHVHNTDMEGFIRALAPLNPTPNQAALILGAGGAARACAAGLLLHNYSPLYILSRKRENAERICAELTRMLGGSRRDLQAIRADELNDFASSISLVVNCTPIGLVENEEIPPWLPELFASIKSTRKIFFDTVYRRDLAATSLMKLAATHAFQTSDGLPMLVEQAALAFQFWTGRLPPAKLMHEAAVQAAKEQ